jgi:hypothetical protein
MSDKAGTVSRKTVIDKVSGVLQVMITHLEYLEVTKDGPVTNDDLFTVLNKTSADVVQMVLDYERAKGLEQQLLSFTEPGGHYDSYQAGYDTGYHVGYSAAEERGV